MSSVINNQYSSLPPLEGNQDQPHLIPFFPSYETSSFQYPISYQPSNTEAYCDQDHDHQQQEVDDHFAAGGSSDSLLLRISMPASNDESEGDNKSTKRYASDTPSRNKTAKWMSSKMRLMRKMMNSYPHQQVQQTSGDSCNSNSSSNGLVRVCSDCNTTKTPLWRTGPQGPKSLCNACGIRQRKARKAMAAAAAMNGDIDSTEKGSDTCNAVIPYKKRYKLEETRKKIKLEDFSISLKKKNSTFHPQDEKEAAILLMALSCDLIYG